VSTRPLPAIPPDQWSSHPAWETRAYPALVGFHDRYRRETSRLVAAAQDAAVSQAELTDSCTRLREDLHNHEAVEEQVLYPWIEEHYAVELGAQREQHAALNRQLDRVIELAPVSPRAALRGELAELDRILRDHLAAEEALCVPVLLGMSAEEFAGVVGD
jgi:iron-sulfur cluster repair protein YtfE (RIC family)